MTEQAERVQRALKQTRPRGRNPPEAAAGYSGEKQYETLPWTSSSGTRDACRINGACCRDEVTNQPQGRWLRHATAAGKDSSSQKLVDPGLDV